MKRWILAILMLGFVGHASADDELAWGVDVQLQYRTLDNVTYLRADGHESKLDAIIPRDTSKPLPTLLYIHGGGWVQGDKERVILHFLPYLRMGFAVVNVGYRLARHALAPAAVEDGRCALRWIISNAAQFGFDTNRIVVSGHSAGGHLALTTGMLPASAGLDRRCPAARPNAPVADGYEPEMRVAAIVNWFGITDVADLVEGENAKTYAIAWMGSQPDWREIAERVSPLTYVREGLPPILTIHGDADRIVPYEHATRLHQELDRAGIVNSLLTIEGGGHGGFNRDELLRATETIRDFLKEQAIIDSL